MEGVHIMSLSINTLFSSFGSSSTNNSFTSGLYSSLSEYSSIKSGTYKKLVSSYYNKTKSTDKTDSTTSASKNKLNKSAIVQKQELSEVKDAADDLYSSASKLTDTSSKGLFKKADKVTSDIASAVNSFVKDYNSLVKEAGDTASSKVTGKVSYMTSQTNAYRSALDKIGITVNDDKTLSINEEVFGKSDISDVKKVFNGSTSMAYQTFVRASDISSAAESAGNSVTSYGADGMYNNYYNSAYNWYL